jgi:hypothetical protein
MEYDVFFISYPDIAEDSGSQEEILEVSPTAKAKTPKFRLILFPGKAGRI